MEYKVYPFDKALHNGSWCSYEHDGFYQVLIKDTSGHTISLSDHQIRDNGIVSPSVVCDRCDYQEHITLEWWTPVNRG